MNVRAALHRLYLILKSNNMLSNFTLESEKREYKMSQTGKWGTFWILVIGIVVGILCTAGLVGVVQWAGTDKFCQAGATLWTALPMHGNKASTPEPRQVTQPDAPTATS